MSVAPVNFPLSVILAAVDKFSSPMDKALGRLELFGAGAAHVGEKIDKYLSEPLREFLTESFQVGATFERQMSKVSAATGASAIELHEIAEAAHKVGVESLFGAEALAKAAERLGRKSRSAEEIISLLPVAAQFARASNTELADSVDLINAALLAFDMPAEAALELTDKLTVGAIKSGKGIDGMLDSFRTAVPIVKSLHLDLDDTVTVIAAFQRGGLAGAKAGTTFTQMLAKIEAGTPAVVKGLAKLGLHREDIFLPTGELRPVLQILERIGAAGGTAGDYIDMFGTKLGPGIAAAVSKGLGPLHEMQDAIGQAGGETADRAARALDGAGYSTARFTESVERLHQAFSDAGVLEWVGGLVDQLTSLVTWLGNLSPSTLRFLAVMAAIGAVLGPAVLFVAQLATGLASMLAILQAVIPVFIAFNFAAAANPIGIVILAIAGLIVSLGLLWKYWDNVVGFMKTAWDLYTWPVRTFVKWIFSIFPKLEGLVPNWAKHMIGIDTGAGLATAPAIDERRVGMAAGGATGAREAKVNVDFKNVPRGVTVTKDANSSAPVDLGVGYQLGGG